MVPATLAASLRGDGREVAAAIEVSVRAGDRAAIGQGSAKASDRDTALASAPIHLPLAPAPTLAELVRWLRNEAAREVAGLPQGDFAEA